MGPPRRGPYFRRCASPAGETSITAGLQARGSGGLVTTLRGKPFQHPNSVRHIVGVGQEVRAETLTCTCRSAYLALTACRQTLQNASRRWIRSGQADKSYFG